MSSQAAETTELTQSGQRPVHVMHIIDKLSVGGSQVHGISKAIEWWIPCFDPAQFTFSVVSLRGVEPFGEVFEKQGTPIDFLDKGKYDVTTLTALIKLIRQRQAGILHLHGYGASNFGRLAGLLTGVPTIIHEHSVFDDQPFHQTVADKLLSPLNGTTIAVSSRVGHYMMDRRSIKADRMHTFFCGLPIAQFEKPENSAVDSLRQEFDIAPGRPVIGSIGRLDTQKGFIYLMQAARKVVAAFPDALFLVVGDGPRAAELESYVAEHGMEKNVRFTGYRTDVPVIMACSDIIAIPSLWEGGPFTLFEAMSLGKPVIGTPVGVMDEVLEDGETGFIVPCKDADALADRLVLLIEQQDRARDIGAAARIAVQDHDISHSIAKLVQIYQSIAKQ